MSGLIEESRLWIVSTSTLGESLVSCPDRRKLRKAKMRAFVLLFVLSLAFLSMAGAQKTQTDRFPEFKRRNYEEDQVTHGGSKG
mmetsp:Transcript_21017/g.85755  ORF Transcript_21017/g.85755 Transcript_21017/m.85755 type:complete len:84 (-) Transcript_21017:8-259(-)